MANVNDVHGMADQVKREREKLENPDHDDYIQGIDEADRQAILEFANHREFNEEVANSTLRNDIADLRRVAQRSDIPLLEFESSKDTNQLLKINADEYGVSEESNDKYRRVMRVFFEWANDDPDYGGFDFWNNIKIPGRKPDPIDPDEILSIEEVRTLREAADHPRDKALIEFLADTGQRLAATMQMKRGDVSGLEGNNPTFKPNRDGEAQKGITTLPMPIIQSQRWLRIWLNQYHPDDHPDSPVFTVKEYHSRERENGAIAPSTALDKLKTLADGVGIDRDRVNVHAFRHVAVTRMRRGMDMDWDDIAHRTDWSDASLRRLKQVYAHLSHEDKNDRIRKAAGQAVEETDEPDTPDSVECINCGAMLDYGAKACPDCGANQNPDTESSYVTEDQAEQLISQFTEQVFYQVVDGLGPAIKTAAQMAAESGDPSVVENIPDMARDSVDFDDLQWDVDGGFELS